MTYKGEIKTFRELMNEVAWSLDKGIDFKPVEDGWTLGKLYISNRYLEYKTERWVVYEGVYDRFLSFLTLLGYDVSDESY